MDNFALIHKEVSKISRQNQATDKTLAKVASQSRQLLLNVISNSFGRKDSEKVMELEKRRIQRKRSF